MKNSNHTNNNHRGLTWDYIEPSSDPVDGAVLLSELRDTFKNYVVLPQWAPEMLALWTLHTYAFRFRDVTAYLGVSSPEKRCGKTTLLGVLSKLVHRPLAAANISPPALFRVIEEAEPTLLIDEADTFLQGNDELRGILNAGYSRETAYVVRVSNELRHQEVGRGVPAELRAGGSTRATHRSTDSLSAPTTDNGPLTTDNNPHSSSHPFIQPSIHPNLESRLVRFSCWCPKVMAAIGRLPDTLADRCIVIRMQRKTPREQCARLKDLNGADLQKRCARFALDHETEIRAARPAIPKTLNDRAADIWEPLLALADLAGADWTELARQSAQALSGSIAESNLIGLLLIHIYDIFIGHKNPPKLFSRDLVHGLNSYNHRPWAEHLKNRLLDDSSLAAQLRPYGVRPRTLWINGVTSRGYLRDDFHEIFGRYITRADLEEVTAKPDPAPPATTPAQTDAPSASASPDTTPPSSG